MSQARPSEGHTSDFVILGICGSLRRGSFNRGLLRAASALVPDGARLEIVEVGDLPLFSEDLEAQGDPPPVTALKERIRAAAAVLIAVPEYNWGVAGPLKNAIDWAARPVATNALKQKPVALVGASTGPWGTTRAQAQLRQTLAYTDSLALPQPNVFVPMAREKFDTDGNLTDERTREALRALLSALVAWARRVASRR